MKLGDMYKEIRAKAKEFAEELKSASGAISLWTEQFEKNWKPLQEALEYPDISTLHRDFWRAVSRVVKEDKDTPDDATWSDLDWDKILKTIVEKGYLKKYEPEKPNFPQIWERVQAMTTLPVDYNLFKARQLYFPFSRQVKLIEDKVLPTGEHFVKYEVDSVMEKVNITFTLPPNEKLPTFRDRALPVFLSIIPFAKAQGTSEPFIKKEHQYKLLGEKRGFYSRIDDILQVFATGYWDYTNKGTGKEFRREIGHLVNKVKWYGKGRGSYYQVSINPEVAKTLIAIVEGKTGKDIPHHISYPIQALAYEPTRETKLIEYVFETIKGHKKPYSRQVKTVLKKGMGVTQKEIKTKSLLWLAGELERGLRAIEKQNYTWELDEENPFQRIVRPDTVKQLGFEKVIKELRILKKPKFKKDIFLKWKILIKPSEILETQKLKLTPEGKNLVEELLEWHYRPEANFNTKNPRERTKVQIENTIKTLGVNRVKEIVEEMNSVDPHPKYFWNKVKYYKWRLKKNPL